MPNSWERKPAADLLDIEIVSSEGPCVRVRASGEIDMLTGPGLGEALETQLDAGQPTVLDLREVQFLGAAGLRVMLDWLRDAERHGINVAVLATDASIHHLLDITGLRYSVPLFRSERAAIEFVRGPALTPR